MMIAPFNCRSGLFGSLLCRAPLPDRPGLLLTGKGDLPAAIMPTAALAAEDTPQLLIAGPALSALAWAVRRSENECCFWGVLEPVPQGLRLREAVLARHQGSPGYSVPDMEWYGDLLAERYEQEGLEPWQLSCWIHTHPAGLDRPSGVDRATFVQHFGRQRLALMLIMTQDLRFYGELSISISPLPSLPPARFTSPSACPGRNCAWRETPSWLKPRWKPHATTLPPSFCTRSPSACAPDFNHNPTPTFPPSYLP